MVVYLQPFLLFVAINPVQKDVKCCSRSENKTLDHTQLQYFEQ